MSNLNRPYLKWLMIMGIIEGFSTLMLFFVAMPLKYVWEMPMAVTITGGLHGIFFLVLIAMFILGKSIVPLPTRLVWWGIIGAIVPFGPFVVDVMPYRLYKQPSSGDQQSP